MITKIPLNCPHCKRRVYPVDVADSATEVVKRRCRCGTFWQVTIALIKRSSDRAFHKLTWLELCK